MRRENYEAPTDKRNQNVLLRALFHTLAAGFAAQFRRRQQKKTLWHPGYLFQAQTIVSLSRLCLLNYACYVTVDDNYQWINVQKGRYHRRR